MLLFAIKMRQRIHDRSKLLCRKVLIIRVANPATDTGHLRTRINTASATRALCRTLQ